MIKELEVSIKNGKSLIFSTGEVKNKILLVFATGAWDFKLSFNLNGENIKLTSVDSLEEALNCINSLENENPEFKEALENAEIKIAFADLYEPGLLDIEFNNLDLDYDAIPYLIDGATMEVDKAVAFEALHYKTFIDDPEFDEFIADYEANQDEFKGEKVEFEEGNKFLKLLNEIDTSFTIDSTKFKDKIVESLKPLNVSVEEFNILEDEEIGHYQQAYSANVYIEGVLFEALSSVFSGSPT